MRIQPQLPLIGAARVQPAPLTVATYNVHNFYDTVDDPATNDPIATPADYAQHLAKTSAAIVQLGLPDVIGLEEIENQSVVDDLLRQPALAAAGYAARFVPGNDLWSHNDAFLYRTSAVHLDALTDANPVASFADGQVAIDSSRLFTTPPAVASFTVAGSGATVGAQQLTVVLNHMKSKVGGTVYDARKLAEGRYVGGLVDAAQAARPDAKVVVMGDLNADTIEPQVQAIMHRADGSVRMNETAELLPAGDRFSYVYKHTQKNLLDHVLVTPSLWGAITSVAIPHFDTQPVPSRVADPRYADGSSDHDAIVVGFDLTAG